MEPKVLFEDGEILVVDKPSGMTVNRSDTTKGERTVQEWLEDEGLNPSRGSTPKETDFYRRAGIVHRLDKETSGLLLVAKTPLAFENLQRQFKERAVKKSYIALVHGKVAPFDSAQGEIRVPVGRLPWNRKRFGVVAGGREAITKYKVIRYFEVRNGKWDLDFLKSRIQDVKDSKSKTSHFSLLEIYPQTGRTHQIRVHLKYFGHPVFSDPLYGGRKQTRADRKILSRLFLHASKISFIHPKTGEKMEFESKLPEELENLILDVRN
ncbi:MAG: RluA family pseudouridine synthase [Candidatus Levybacteria bacterium]|nr:RluA family pseudouridine synthase [Candidatus Levybacteria bacterium]